MMQAWPAMVAPPAERPGAENIQPSLGAKLFDSQRTLPIVGEVRADHQARPCYRRR